MGAVRLLKPDGPPPCLPFLNGRFLTSLTRYELMVLAKRYGDAAYEYRQPPR